MDKEMDFMIRRFPRYRGLVIRLFAISEDFKAVCEDYWQCSSNIEKMKAEPEDYHDKRMMSEYHLLRLELESEALRMLHVFRQNVPDAL